MSTAKVFTLIELLVVIAIIALLMVILLPPDNEDLRWLIEHFISKERVRE